MPNRILREGILGSDSVNSLSWEAEVFYRRLMSVVDDFGLFDGRESILKGQMYALKPDVRVTDISRWIAECETAGLIACYESEGKPYLLFHKLGEPRAKYPKFPPPPAGLQATLQTSANICAPMRAFVPPYALRLSNSNSPTPHGSASELFERFWKAYPKKSGRNEAIEAFEEIGPDEALLAKMLAAIAWKVNTPDWTKESGRFIPKAAKWLTDGRWEEAPDRVLMPTKAAESTLKLREQYAAERAKALPPAELAKTLDKIKAKAGGKL
jgi:hypothetical protein